LTHDKVIQELLKSACPSIEYRVRRELLGESIDSQPMKAIQREFFKTKLSAPFSNPRERTAGSEGAFTATTATKRGFACYVKRAWIITIRLLAVL